MKIITLGHKYEVENMEGGTQTIQFIEKIKKIDESAPEGSKITLETVENGTTNEEVLAVLIDRIQYLNTMVMCRENSIVITKLQEALMWLNKRTESRVERGVENTGNA